MLCSSLFYNLDYRQTKTLLEFKLSCCWSCLKFWLLLLHSFRHQKTETQKFSEQYHLWLLHEHHALIISQWLTLWRLSEIETNNNYINSHVKMIGHHKNVFGEFKFLRIITWIREVSSSHRVTFNSHINRRHHHHIDYYC